MARQKQKLELIFCLGPHVTAENALRLEHHIANADVFSPEGDCLGHDAVDFLEKSYSSEYDYMKERFAAEEKRRSPFWPFTLKLEDLIYKYKPKIRFIESHSKKVAEQLEKQKVQVAQLDQDALAYFMQGQFEQAVQTSHQSLLLEASVKETREENIIKNSRNATEGIFGKYPELEEKAALRYVISLGSLHTKPYEVLGKEQKDGIVVQLDNPYAGNLPSTKNELIKEIQYQEKLDYSRAREKIAKSLFEKVIACSIAPDNPLHEKFYSFWLTMKGLTTEITLPEIQKMSQTFGEAGENGQASPEKLFEIRDNLLSKYGLSIPSTKVDINKFLEQKYEVPLRDVYKI